jgi:GATA-binding protein, other eukaryote
MCLQCGAAVTPQWRSGPMGQGTLCNAYRVRLKVAGVLRDQVKHRPTPATARTPARPPLDSPAS